MISLSSSVFCNWIRGFISQWSPNQQSFNIKEEEDLLTTSRQKQPCDSYKNCILLEQSSTHSHIGTCLGLAHCSTYPIQRLYYWACSACRHGSRTDDGRDEDPCSCRLCATPLASSRWRAGAVPAVLSLPDEVYSSCQTTLLDVQWLAFSARSCLPCGIHE